MEKDNKKEKENILIRNGKLPRKKIKKKSREKKRK